MQSIAAVVNDEVVSMLDLAKRVELVIFESGLQSTGQVKRRIARQVLESLIDERLQLQEARRHNITVSSAEMAAHLADIERRSNLPVDSLEEYLGSRGVDRQTMRARIRATLAWRQLLQRRLPGVVAITDEQVDEELAVLKASQGVTQYLISEIVLAAESMGGYSAAQRGAERLVEQVRAAAEINPTAPSHVGTVSLGNLPPEQRQAVNGQPVGSIGAPVTTEQGVRLFMVCDGSEPAPDLPSREEIRRALMQQRLSAVSRGYLGGLRQSAFIEKRL